MDIVLVIIQFALAGVLVVAAVGKLRDLDGSRKAARDFGVPQQWADPLGTALPFGELVLGVLLLVGATARVAALGALLLFLVFIAGIAWNLRQGRQPDCHCFGEFHSAPASWRTIARNSLFTAMAAVVVVANARGPMEVYDSLTVAGQVGVWLALLIASLGAGHLWFLNQVRSQQRHLREEFDELATSLAFQALGNEAPAVSMDKPVPFEEPVGEPAPDLDLPTLDGGRLTLGTLRAAGQPALLLFTVPDCGYCSAMYPEVEEWSQRFSDDLLVAVIGSGELEANRESVRPYAFPIVAVDVSGKTSREWDAVESPTGYIVQANGSIVDQPARGRNEIQRLVGRALLRRQRQQAPIATGKPVSASTPVQEVDSWPAPSFDLPGYHGGRVSLGGLLAKGKPVLVIFWAPDCGFCTQFGSELGEWIARFGSEVTFAVISRGTPEINRDHVERFGLTNVGLQENNEVMQMMGGFGTPSAVLIRSDGFIQDEVAVGAPQIRRLLGRAISRDGGRRNAVIPAAPPAVPTDGNAGSKRGDQSAASTQEDHIRSFLQNTAARTGPEVGTAGTRLPWSGLDGAFVGLDEYRGDEVVLLFWGADCELSQRMLIDLKEWELSAGDTVNRVLVISSGDPEANREQHLRSRILLDDSFTAGSEFGVTGTPAAIRLDADGRVASELAQGADAVLDLLYDFSESRAGAVSR